MVDSPSSGAPAKVQDGISWIQKVTAVETVFRGAPGCFWGTWIYIGGRSRSVDVRGAHEDGGRAGHPCGRLVCFLPSIPSPLDDVCSKKSLPKVSFRLDSV